MEIVTFFAGLVVGMAVFQMVTWLCEEYEDNHDL
jgi:hypothetical protein